MSATLIEADDMATEKPLVQKAIQEEKMTYPCYLDPGAAWQKGAGVTDIPTFMVVNRDGKIVHKVQGKLTEGSEGYQKITKAIDSALAAK